MIAVFLYSDAAKKVVYLITSEMHRRYHARLLRNWDRINGQLQFIGMVNCGNHKMADVVCLTQNT